MIPEQLKLIVPHCKNPGVFATLITAGFEKYNFNKDEQAWFVAQTAHESMSYNRLSENLNYSAKGLLATFPKYFTPELAKQYERQPEKIANHVYANRLGNGDEASGEGYKYRGKGLIQVTGKDNHKACSRFLFHDDRLLDNPDLLIVQDNAVNSAFWFWITNNINSLVKLPDAAKRITKRINGAYFGLEERIKFYEQAKKVL
jgi:putative chitinase